VTPTMPDATHGERSHACGRAVPKRGARRRPQAATEAMAAWSAPEVKCAGASCT